MFSKILTAPFLLGALFFLYLTWEVDDKYAVYIIPCVVLTVVLFMLGPQVDWWWYRRHPPEIKPKLRAFLEARFPFYQKLDEAEKKRFRHRMALYMEANEFVAKGMEEVPSDLKAVVAATAVQATFRRKDWLMSKFEHIIIYPHPFPSPQYEQWHACEHFEEDGAIIFSAEQLMAGFLQPSRYFSVGLYEYARVFHRCYPQESFPNIGEGHWPALQQIGGMSKEVIEKWIGLPEVDPIAVAVAHYFTFPERFAAVLPDEFAALAHIFNPTAPAG